MSQQRLPTTREALDLVRGYRAAQAGEIINPFETPHWKQGHMKATEQSPALRERLLIESLARDFSSKSQRT